MGLWSLARREGAWYGDSVGQGLQTGQEPHATWESPFPSLGPVSNEKVGLEDFFISFLFWEKREDLYLNYESNATVC